jgi:hypothetical protein
VTELIAEHEVVVLTGDVLGEGLEAGDVGVVLLVHPGQGDVPPGYTIEVTNLMGETVAVVDVSADLVRPVEQRDVRHARSVPVSA